MNLFELYAKISVDDSEFKKSMENAKNVSKNVANAMKELQSPLDKIKSGFNDIKHPIETAKNGFETLKNKIKEIRHPIETFKAKVQESSTALETQRNKLSVLASGYDSAKKKVDELTKEFNKSAKESGTSSEKTKKLADELKKAEKEAEEAKKEMDDYAQSVSKAGKNSEDAKEKISKLINGLGTVAKGIGSGLVTAAKVGTAAVGAAATGVIALTKSAIDGFSEYEQLAGGAAKIFDEMSQTQILQDAQNAYKDLGLSANQYLSVMNDVGATFAATMGDEAGYNAAKTGLKAISDYASGTGKNVDELSQKFTLITRSTSSYQSIADQFSGILPATSAGFLEQAQAAGILSDSYEKLTEVPIDEYQEAVSQMLEKGVEDLGLANNAANEAATTISGSLAALKGSWSNLVTGLADDNADFDLLMGNFVESTANAAKNILPRVGTALKGIGKLVKELVPVAMEFIPQIIGDFLPEIAEAAVSIVTSIGSSIIDNLDKILGWGQDMLDSLIDGIMKTSSSDISATVTNIITSLGNFVISNLPQVLSAGIEILFALANGIIDSIPELATVATQAIVDFASYLISGENISNILDTAGKLIEALSEGIESAVGILVDVGADVVQSIIDGISAAWSGLVSWFNGIWDSLFDNRTANVTVNKTTTTSGRKSTATVNKKTTTSGRKSTAIDGSHANGLDYVPFDSYIAELHRGEAVLTASEADDYRRGEINRNSCINIVQNIYSEAKTAADLMQEAIYQQERAVLLGV